MKYWFKIFIHCKKNKQVHLLLLLFLMKSFSLFSDSNTKAEIKAFSLPWPGVHFQPSAVVQVILKKPQTNQNPIQEMKVKRILVSFNDPSFSDLFNILVSGVRVGISCYCIGICFSIWVCKIPISQWCMPTISMLENREINTGTTVLHYCIATRENYFPPFFPNDSHLPKSHNLKSCFSSWCHFFFAVQLTDFVRKRFASQSFLFFLW